MSVSKPIHDVIAERRAEAERLRAAAPELRAMAKGAAVAAKVVPEALAAKAVAAGMPSTASAKLVELAGDAAEDVVTKLLEQAAKAEARAQALEELIGQLGTVAGQFDAAAGLASAPSDEPTPDTPDAGKTRDGAAAAGESAGG